MQLFALAKCSPVITMGEWTSHSTTLGEREQKHRADEVPGTCTLCHRQSRHDTIMCWRARYKTVRWMIQRQHWSLARRTCISSQRTSVEPGSFHQLYTLPTFEESHRRTVSLGICWFIKRKYPTNRRNVLPVIKSISINTALLPFVICRVRHSQNHA
jgi:hypothetical protein